MEHLPLRFPPPLLSHTLNSLTYYIICTCIIPGIGNIFIFCQPTGQRANEPKTDNRQSQCRLNKCSRQENKSLIFSMAFYFPFGLYINYYTKKKKSQNTQNGIHPIQSNPIQSK